MIDPLDPTNYLIYPLIDQVFNSNNINTIDFKRHLKAEHALLKVTEKGQDGRPVKSSYYHSGALIAVIYFNFATDQNNLVTHRQEVLRYIDNNNQESFDIILKDKYYDYSNLVDIEAVVDERIKARKSIVSSIKGFLYGVLQQGGMTQQQALQAGADLWTQYDPLISEFIEFGTSSWLVAITAHNPNTSLGWLASVIDGNGTTIKDYIVSRLTY